MSKRNSMYKGTPRDSSTRHVVRELAHMHNMEQLGIKYPKSISQHDLKAQLIKISDHFNRQILAEQQIAAYHGREPDMEKINEIRKMAEHSAKLCTLRFLKRESSYVPPEKTEKRENLRRFNRIHDGRYMGNVIIRVAGNEI